jgi:hypothetical protein
MSAPTKMIFIRDRTVTLQFDLRRDITGDTIYFAMKSDRSSDFYDVDPIECTITNACCGQFEVTVTNDLTMNLPISRYYGELTRVTSSGAIQTLQMFQIDLRTEIISSRDISV